MMRNPTTNCWNLAAQFFLGSIALSMVTLACFRLGVDLAPTAFAYLVVILLCSLMGSFTASALLAIISIAGLDYFFIPPIFSFRIDDPQLLILVVAFFLTSLVVTRLIRHGQERMEAALQAEANLRRSEADLRDSEKEWREVFEHNPVMYFMVDATGAVLYVNTVGAAQLGYSATDLAGQSVLNVFLEEDREFVRKCIAVCLETIGQSHTWEIRKVRKDGSLLWVRENAKAMRRADNQPIVLIACEDVTERRQTEIAVRKAFDEIKKSEDRLQLVIDTIPTLVWRAGPEGNPHFLNQPALDYTGLTLDQAAAGWPLAFHPDDKPGMLEKWRAIRESGMRGELEARLRRFDGEYRWFLFRAEPLRDELGKIVKWYGSSTDIEDRKVAEVALRDSEQRFRDYAETASDWLWETGPDHTVIRVSDHLNAVGIVPSRLPGMARWDIASDVETEPEKWLLHRAVLDAHLPFRDFVYRAASGTGSAVYFQTSGKPFFDANGKFLGYRGVGTDVTATIRADHAEEALRKTQAELAHVSRVTMLGELTASISHEVNQPLAAVVNAAAACLRWLDGDTPNLDEARRAVDWIIKEGNRASEVIRRVRALAKKTDIGKVPLDINGAIKEVMALMQRELSSHRVLLRTELASALPMILGDRVQLQQVITNLVMNGVEAMQPTTDRTRELMIRSQQDEQRRVLVTVTDSGIGISAENADRLFNAFFTTKSGGLGMGLSICRSIVEAHGGRLWTTANLPHGATFHFALPVYTETASQGLRP
jgi:PAS domain S-box-containing protein